MRNSLIFLLLICTASCGGTAPSAASRQVATNDDDTVVDFFHGDRVSDPFRQLEDDDAAEAWLGEQRKTAASFFAGASDIRDRIIALEKQKSPRYAQLIQRGGRLFALKLQPPMNQPMIVAMPSWDRPEQEEILVDPNRLDPSGATAIDWFVPSYNGKLIAVSLSKNDSEEGDIHIYKISKTKPKRGRKKRKGAAQPSPAQNGEPYPALDEVIPRVNRATNGGSLVWKTNNKGFYYTRYPNDSGSDGVLNQKVYFHKLGTDYSEDRLELGSEIPRIGRVRLELDDRSDRIIATVQLGKAQRFAHYLRNPNGKWQALSSFEDGAREIIFSPTGGMFVTAYNESKRGKVLFLPSPKEPLSKAKRLIPESKGVLVSGVPGRATIAATATRLYLNYLTEDGRALRIFSLDGRMVDEIRIPHAAVSGAPVSLEREEILIPMSAYNALPSWWRYDGQLGEGSLTKTRLSTAGLETDDIEVTNLFAVSPEGVKIPITVVHKRGLPRTGSAPLVLSFAGAFGAYRTPRFDSPERLWLDNGGALAYAALRGGGELGMDWHTAGIGVYKQNTFDDLYTCAAFLVAEKYTNSDSLALVGEGADAMAAAVTANQHPEAIGAVVAVSGFYDMMRTEYTAGGESALSEFGSNGVEAEYRPMIAYSPYHHIPRRTQLPATLLITGPKDPVYPAWQSRKMVARLQQEQSGSAPILLKSPEGRGRGRNLPFMQKLQESAEILYFLKKTIAN